MRLLAILPKLPGDPVDGHVIRSRPFMQRFVEIADVDVIAFDRGSMEQSIANGARSSTVIEFQEPERPPIWTRAAEFLSPDSIHLRDANFEAALRTRLRAETYDAIWVAGWRMLIYLPLIRSLAGPQTRIIADVIDDEVRGIRIHRSKSSSKRVRARLLRDLIRYQRYQRRYLPHADLALFVSQGDVDSTRARLPRLPVALSQNGVDTRYFAPRSTTEPTSDAPPVLVFEGTMSYRPNVEGACHLVKEILPRVQELTPGTRVILVGRDPAPEVRALESDDVELTGTVDDVRSHLRRGTVFACALLSGTGLKNKLLQAWSMGMPVVATPISIGGLGAVDKVHALVEGDPQLFAEACHRLLHSPSLREELGAAGRSFAQERYSIDVKVDEVEKLIRQSLDSSP